MENKTVAELEEQLQLQELVSNISATLIDLPADQVDYEIESALKRLIDLLKMDRSDFSEFSTASKEFVITHRAVAANNNAPEQSGMASQFSIPVQIGGSTQCVLGFGSRMKSSSPPGSVREQLKRAGEVFAQAIYRKRAEYKMKEQVAFERWISELSAKLIDAPIGQVEKEVQNGLQQLLLVFDLDRCNLWKIKKGIKEATIAFACSREGILPAPSAVNYAEQFPWIGRRLISGEIVAIRSGDLPPEAEIDRRNAERLGLRSWLLIPIIVKESVNYVLSIIMIRSDREWPEEVISRIEVLGRILINALVRKQTQEELLNSYREIQELKDRLQVEAEYLRSEVKLNYQYEEIIGESKAIREVLAQVEQVAGTASSVLISGETGTGKELIAIAIHNLSPRKNRSMVKLNCASLPPTLIESELFGREKGAYTGALTKQMGRFEIADGSTIFLDEVGELSLDLQAKLLRVLQEGEFERLGSPRTIKVDVRIIAATNRNLSLATQQGNFREDLYYRLNVFPITVPPLRARPKDIPLLVMAFLNEFNQIMGKKIETVPKQTLETLVRYQWPGNVRELRNVMEHAVIISRGNTLSVQLPQEPHGLGAQRFTLNEMEARHITEVLELTNWIIKGPNGAAKLLGMKPSTLYNRMHKLGVVNPRKKI